MSEKIVKINPASALVGEPDADLIEVCEGLLAEAKAGNLRALAYATVRSQGTKGTGWCGSAGMRDPLSATIGMLHSRYFSALLGGE